MNQKTFNHLGYLQIKEEISRFAMTETGKELILASMPSVNKKQIESWLDEVAEGASILEKSSSVPISAMGGMERLFEGINKGVALRAEQLTKLLEFLDSSVKMKRFMKDKDILAPRVASYAEAIEEIPELTAEIHRCVRNNRIDDHASKDLMKIRRSIASQQDKLKEKITSIIKSSKFKTYLQDQVVSERHGRYVISVKKEYKGKIKGTVLDTSASGSTIFVEPEEVYYLQEDLNLLKVQEETEIEKVLSYLTGLVEERETELRLAAETMIVYDVIFAKAKHSRLMSANKVMVADHNFIDLKEARHPLLGNHAVPLNLTLGDEHNVLVITGPNTGGKTVTLKTAGLLILMVQSGFHIPAAPHSTVGIFQKILIDIGDGQSIEQNLSTFSSHIKNVIEILKEANDSSLVLMDELGSGTDPGEGMGLAAMILDQLERKGCTVIATTHYSEIKEFADLKEGFINGSMEFDLETLKPTYRLIIGKGGESQAFTIALKLGMHPELIERAHKITYKEEKRYSIENADYTIKKDWEKQVSINKYPKKEKKKSAERVQSIYSRGDNILVQATGEHGIIYDGPDDLGNYIIQVKGVKRSENHKRLKLYIKASDLYPDDYDFSIIFDSKEDRKTSKLMQKRHVEGLVIRKQINE
ncbi:MutS2 family protein [Peribacillus deserti]|uniref:MutS2 family protein n=1 Tax=Peribacillus deserti TaxID=673318 RepID=A0ABS2QKA2_9BACI|nr:endonuclease MutS2 [Peribacillus deserti]MBM7693385.1 MutS2 family protein [Peribacillus deserti]